MKRYIVGGYVRDTLMGLEPHDRDWVLVGASVEELQQLGWVVVGKDFPVFIDDEGEEIALARVERKNGTGYTGFSTKTEGVTLEEDLLRRDLTINAIAYDPITEEYIDYHDGIMDLKNKVLRHVSDAFSEDPLRVLRLARFSAKFPDFTIHESTIELAKNIVQSNELLSISKERIFMETRKAMDEAAPDKYFSVLDDVGALKQLFGINITKTMRKGIASITSKCTPAYKEEFIWTYLLNGTELQIPFYNGIPITGTVKEFNNFICKYKTQLQKFKKLTPSEIADFFMASGIKNKGEQFLYKANEYMFHVQSMDYETEELILKSFDQFVSVEIGDIQEMINTGKLQRTEIKSFVHDKYTKALTLLLQ